MEMVAEEVVVVGVDAPPSMIIPGTRGTLSSKVVPTPGMGSGAQYANVLGPGIPFGLISVLLRPSQPFGT